MSIRAYKVKKIDHETIDSFNVYHDEELLDILEKYGFYDSLNEDCCGLTEIVEADFQNIKQDIEAMIKKVEHKDLKEHYREVLTEMEKEISANGYIMYYCY